MSAAFASLLKYSALLASVLLRAAQETLAELQKSQTGS